MQQVPVLFKKLSLLLFITMAFNVANSQDLYWVGGSGDWDDVSKWYKDAAGVNAAGIIPDDNSTVYFTNQSSATNNWTVTFPPGVHEVENILVQTADNFKFDFNGVDNNNAVELNIYGDIDLSSNLNLTYSHPEFHNEWVFKGANDHNIQTGNNDLQFVVFEEGTFNQLSNLKASERIHMLGGTWNTYGYNVNSGFLLFNDGLPSNATRPPRVLNGGNSNILCTEWDSRNTYGSLSTTGTFHLYVAEFKGSPANGGPPFQIPNIHLTEYSDVTNGSTSAVDHYNFVCKDCEIGSMIIEDTGLAILADAFTVTGKLTIVNPGLKVLFNGGNGRSNEVTLNGDVVTPAVSGCDNRVVFENVYNDFTSILRTTGGTLTVKDAVLNNIQASGSANFDLVNGLLQGSSTGWNVSNPPTPTQYFWKGTVGGVFADWNDHTNWTIQGGGSNGCIPSIVDDVFIDANAKSNIRIPANYTAECNNFIWTNKDGLELLLDGTTSLGSELKIAGSFELESSATITALNQYLLQFSSSSSPNTITTNGVALPRINFVGDNAQWYLMNDLICDEVYFEGGTLNTQGNDIDTDYWVSIESNPKVYNFSSSTITVDGEMSLSRPIYGENVTVTGSSLIVCDRLTSMNLALHNVKLTNTSNINLGGYPYIFNTLILAGTGQVNTVYDLTLNDLVFETDGATLALDANDLLVINGGIESTTSAGNPAILKSNTSGTRAEIDKAAGNICVLGPVDFQDIQGVLSGVFNAPEGIDSGNNDNVNFDNGTSSDDLYWIAQNGGNWQVQKNWSRITGGCPATKNPQDAPNLFFDSNSFTATPVTVTIPSGATCNNLFFRNSENFTLDVSVNLYPDAVFVEGGYINLVGKTFDVAGEVTIESSGLMTTDMLNFVTEKLSPSSGAFVVKSGSTAKVKQP